MLVRGRAEPQFDVAGVGVILGRGHIVQAGHINRGREHAIESPVCCVLRHHRG